MKKSPPGVTYSAKASAWQSEVPNRRDKSIESRIPCGRPEAAANGKRLVFSSLCGSFIWCNPTPQLGSEIAQSCSVKPERQTIDRLACSVWQSQGGTTMRLRKLMVFFVAFWVVGALCTTDASAQFRLRVEDPTTGMGVVISDGNADDMSGGADGVIMFMLSGLGGAGTTTSVTIAQGRGAPYNTSPGVVGDLYLNSLTISSTGPAKLLLTLEDTGYSSTPNSWLQLTSHMINNSVTPGTESGFFNAAAGSKVTVQSFITSGAPPAFGAETGATQTSLAAMGTSSATGTGEQLLSPGSSLTGDKSASFYSPGSFSLFTQVYVDLTGVGTSECQNGFISGSCAEVSFYQDAYVVSNDALNGTPEPASLMLISSGLLGLAGAGRRRFLQKRA